MGDTQRLGGETLAPGLPDSGLVFSSGCSVAGILGVHKRLLRCLGGGRGPREPGDSLTPTLTSPGENKVSRGEGEGMEDIEVDRGLYLGLRPFRLRVTRR